MNSVLVDLHGDLVQVKRNICSKLSSLWDHHSSPVSHSSQSSTSSRSLSDKAEKESRSKGKAYIAKRKAKLLHRLDRLQHLSEGMSVPTMSDVISTSAVSGDQICTSMDSTTNDRNSTGLSDNNSTFHSSSGPLDKPVVSPQCTSLDETVSKDSLVHSLSTNPLSQDLISNSAGKEHLDCNHPQNSIHVSSDCTESHNSNYHNSVVLRSAPQSCQTQLYHKKLMI